MQDVLQARHLVAGWLLLMLAGVGSPARSQGLPAEEAALLMSGEQGGALSLESTVVVWHVDGDRAELRISLELPVADLIAGGAQEVGLRWVVYALDDSGSLVASLVRSASADRRRLEASGAAGVRVLETLEVPAVPLSIRALVRELDSMRFGLRVHGADAAAGPRAFVPRRQEGWIELGSATSGTGPAALATARAGGRVELLVPEGADVAGVSWVLAETGTEDAPPPPPAAATALESMGEEGDGWRRVALALPEGARGGRELRRDSDPPGSGASILVLPPEASGSSAWPEVARATSTRATPGPATPTGDANLRAPKVREELIEVLSTIAADGPDAGATALRRALDAAREAAGDPGLTVVADEGLRLGVEVVQAGSASLAPLLATLDRLYESCQGSDDHACVGVTLVLFRGLLESSESAGVQAPSVHADAWTLLGWLAAERQVYGQAADALRRAARLEAGHASSRLALTVLLELTADYREAAGVLEGLVEDHPSLGEAWLRLGVQYRRLGRRRAAQQTFAEAYRRGPDWIRVVARQELAALQRERGETERAAETLRQTIEEFPREEQLKLQLAALLDASGRSAEAGALLNDLQDTAEGDLAARHRYATLPVAELQSVRARLRHDGEERRGALGSALEALAR